MLLRMPIRNLKTVTRPMYELHDRLHTLLHATPAADAPLAAQPLTEQVKVFERIERGKLDRHRADPTFIREVEQAVDQIIAVFYTPLDGRPFIVPRNAWTHSPLMKLLASVTYWLYQDDLISMADAARLVYGASDDALREAIESIWRRRTDRGTRLDRPPRRSWR